MGSGLKPLVGSGLKEEVVSFAWVGNERFSRVEVYRITFDSEG